MVLFFETNGGIRLRKIDRKQGLVARGLAAMQPPVRSWSEIVRSSVVPFSFGFVWGIFLLIAFLTYFV